MSEARQHHFVPQCYLKGFTHNGSKNSALYVVDIQEARPFTTVPARVAKKRDFNRIDGLPAGELDNRLSGFETKLADALEKIGAARTLEDADAWLHVVNLIALLAIRNPRMRESMRQFAEQAMRIAMDLALATPELWESMKRRMARDGALTEEQLAVPYERIREFQDRGEYTIERSPGWHIRREFKTLDDLLPHLVRRTWLLCIAGPGAGDFISSDHPVCLIHSDGAGGSLSRPIGYALGDTTVIFPVNRSLLAVGTFDGARGARELTTRQVAYFNSVVAAHAERQLYAPDERFAVMLDSSGRIGRADDLLRRVAKTRKR